jgi:hypothetical protein
VRRREDGSDEDVYEWFAELHRGGRLLPPDEDRLRHQAAEAVRSLGRLRTALFELVDTARDDPENEHDTHLDAWLRSRALSYRSEVVEEIWCAISVRAIGRPTGDVGWFEAVRLGMR